MKLGSRCDEEPISRWQRTDAAEPVQRTGIRMDATVWRNRIEIRGSGALPTQAWQPLLKDLEAEHVPPFTPRGYRFAMAVSSGASVATIYRTHSINDEEIIETVRVLREYGIAATIGLEGDPHPLNTARWQGK